MEKWHPVAFLSKSLMVTERNYEIYNKELLSIMLALDEWRHYLMGAAQDFEIWTDHQNLQYFRKPQKLNRRQACWVTELVEYHFSLHHKPGALNKKADLLSRRADHDTGKEDNDEVIVLKPEHFRALVMPTIEEVHTKIKQATLDRPPMGQEHLCVLNHDRGMKLDDGLIYYDHHIYIPQDHALRGEIIAASHNHITAGHPGIEKTKELVLREYWWPKMKKDIENYVRTCETCQRTKSSTQAKAAPLHPNAIPSRPWYMWILWTKPQFHQCPLGSPKWPPMITRGQPCPPMATRGNLWHSVQLSGWASRSIQHSGVLDRHNPWHPMAKNGVSMQSHAIPSLRLSLATTAVHPFPLKSGEQSRLVTPI